MNIAIKNATKLEAIQAAGISYRVRKYAGAWVPVVIADGKVRTFPHCSTSFGAMGRAIDHAAEMANA